MNPPATARRRTGRPAVWLGGLLLGLAALALAYRLLVPDECDSGIYTEGRTISIGAATGKLKLEAKVSAANQQIIGEQLQFLANQSRQLCKLHRTKVIDDSRYLTELKALEDRYLQLVAAAKSGIFADREIPAGDVDAVILRANTTPSVLPGPFIIFYDWDRSAVTPEAAAVLDNVASQCRALRQQGQRFTLEIVGNSDFAEAAEVEPSPGGTYLAGKTASAKRMAAVVNYIRSRDGQPCSGFVTYRDAGTSNPLVPTAPGVREPQNRRVEIEFRNAV